MDTGKKLRVVLADDCAIVRDCLRSLLTREAQVVLVGEAADGEVAMQLCIELSPDVVLMDISMPHVSGLEAAARIRASGLSVKVIAVTMHSDLSMLEAALRAGVHGYMQKNHASRELVPALRAVMAGEIFIGKASSDALRRASSTLSLPPVLHDLAQTVRDLLAARVHLANQGAC